jgi:alanine dehydrogenase
MIIGGGVVGYNAATTAASLGTNVVQFEANPKRIVQLKADPTIKTLTKLFKSQYVVEASTPQNIEK